MIDLPAIINGKAYYPDASTDTIRLEYESGTTVRMPRLSLDHVKALRAELPALKRELASLTVYDVAEFLARAAPKWYARDSEKAAAVVKRSSELTGYSPQMIANDYDAIAHFISLPANIYDLVICDLGHEKVMEDWLPVLSSYQKAFPKGLALHYLVGNLPLASLGSIVRSIITRNVTFAKLPTRDPFTPLSFLQTLIDMDPTHPISRSFSAGYWAHDDEVENDVLALADVVCVWGGESAVAAVKSKTPVGTHVVEFGPRWSAAVVDTDQVDSRKAAYRLATDVCYYDQEACFNTQRVFLRGDPDAFLDHVADRFEAFAKRMPKITRNRDALAHWSASLLDSRYLGWKVRSGADWAAVVVPQPEDFIQHPLGRTVVIHPVADFDGVARYLNRRTQTVSALPWTVAEAYRDAWAVAGADRIVELGTARRPRQGFTHDGTLALRDLVKIACVERPLGEHFRKDWKPLEELERNLFVTE